MPLKTLTDFLDKHHVRYVRISHSPAFTAQEIAASAHIPGKELAKTVMVKVDGELQMAVLPANDRLDFNRVRSQAHADEVELATEDEFRDAFPECELGAMPPFGNLFGLKVMVDDDLAEDEQIAFSAWMTSWPNMALW